MTIESIDPDRFSTLPPEEQDRIMKEIIMNMTKEERQILKILIDNEKK